ncbi:MAG TPA: DUF3761 domain-containing protein [Polyangia bacterium]|nr:DUF3761 domain-containing protein [Polyangia bacterium]
MRRLKWLILVVFATAGAARIPIAIADTESTVTCKDGTTSKGGKGACSHHGGIASDADTKAAPAPKNEPAAKPSSAPPPAAAPMVKCKDGSESKGGKGACSHHGGVASGEMGGSAPAEAAPPAAPPSTQGRSAPPSSRPESPSAPPKAGQPTAKCKDGSMSYSSHHSGACSHHGGVVEWLGSP